MIVKKTLNQSVYDKAVQLGQNTIVATIIANRITDPNLVESILSPAVDVVPPLNRLVDSSKAAHIIYNHLIKGSNIVAITDSDSDGVSSAGIIFRSIIEYFNHDPESLHILVNERKFGNGVNNEMVRRTSKIHDVRKVDLVITADHGSSDDERFKKLKEIGVEDIVVTDHHLLPTTGTLQNVDAFVNPQRPEDTFSPNISGCHVIFLVMQLVYDLFKLNNHRLLKEDRLQFILPIMTNTILSDQMDMSDPINRYYLKEGLKELSNSNDSIWIALRELVEMDKEITEQTVSFLIAPLLNAANRTGKAYIAYEYLTAPDFHTALQKLKTLINLNNERKKTEAEMLSIANLGIKTYPYKNSIITLLPHGIGVAGLISQTIGDKLQVPAFTFVENNDGELSGSGRGIVPHVDLKLLLDVIKEKYPGIIIKGGGHKGAAGCTINAERLVEFMRHFDEEIINQLADTELVIKYEYDLEIPFGYIGEKLYNEIQKAGPYGRGYPNPIIKTECLLEKYRLIGKPPIHSVLTIFSLDRKVRHDGFYPKSSMIPLYTFKNKQSTLLFTLGKKRYLGKTVVSPTVSYLELKKDSK